jgi:hypothetical protein
MPAPSFMILQPVPSAPAALSRQSRNRDTQLRSSPMGRCYWPGGWICCGSTIATAEIYHPAVLKGSPVLLSVTDKGQGAILHASTHRLVSPDSPAVVGEALEI